jgi:methylenetetrahydrofolate dehydrogenase (NADP+)/methenyltetrahydrofolate cyclohydrolase
MAILLEGKTIRDDIRTRLTQESELLLTKKGLVPCLAIIQVGNRIDSTTFIQQKKTFALSIGVKVLHCEFPITATEEEIATKIGALNNDSSVHGIIIQLPLPTHIPKTILNRIDPIKDVDGLTTTMAGLVWQGSTTAFLPATTRGVLTLVDHYKISVDGKKVTVIGKSDLVGKPVALALLNRGATLTICHKKTKDLAAHTKSADIIVSAAGASHLITEAFVSPDQIIIDIGINQNPDNTAHARLVGDVDFKNVYPLVAALTPVPGGIGPLTVASLFENLFDAVKNQTAE